MRWRSGGQRQAELGHELKEDLDGGGCRFEIITYSAEEIPVISDAGDQLEYSEQPLLLRAVLELALLFGVFA